MCGIIGYIGGDSALDVVIEGLESLEYRGYDSAGLATIDKDKPVVLKQVGRVAGLKDLLERQDMNTSIAIGHTRWATHGGVNIKNAHPHTNSDNTIFVVHNGIIENANEIGR